MKQKQRRTRMDRKRQLYLRIGMFVVLFVIAVIFVIQRRIQKGNDVILTPPRVWSREEGMACLRELAEKDSEYEQICRKADLYPDNLISALCNNKEMLDYVKKYPETEKKVYGTLTASERRGEIPLLMQWDERWGYVPYGDDVIALSACGPTSLSMVLVGLTGNIDAAPNHVADYAMKQGFYIPGTGTAWDLMTLGAAHFGVRGQDISPDKETITALLKEGQPVICSMYPGDFTAKGHFVVLTGIEHGKIRLNDCMSKARSKKLWSWDTFEPQINHAWTFTLE